MTAQNASVNPADSAGQPQTLTPSGNGGQVQTQDFTQVGALNAPVAKASVAVPVTQGHVQPAPVVQPQTKDDRHAAQKIGDLSEKRLKYARIAVESDQDNIYKIAEEEPEVAEKLLKEFDYGVETLEELLQRKENPDAKPEDIKKEVQKDKRFQAIEKKLLDSEVERLRSVHPDLTGELEEAFREVYSDPHYSDEKKFPLEKKYELARVLSGKTSQTTTANDMALDMLNVAEGSISAPRATTVTEKRPLLSAELAKRIRESGVDPAKAEQYLDPNIDQILSETLRFAR